jgi:hypothetical protein
MDSNHGDAPDVVLLRADKGWQLSRFKTASPELGTFWVGLGRLSSSAQKFGADGGHEIWDGHREAMPNVAAFVGDSRSSRR